MRWSLAPLLALVLLASGCGGPEPARELALDVVAGPAAASDFRRTIILIHGETSPGQDLFVRGGIDHDQARNLMGKNCTSANFECAIPIRHKNLRNATTQPWKVGDAYLDWYGREARQTGQSHDMLAEGTAADWTTNYWPRFWGPERTVAVDGYGVEELNRFGMHYWMIDVEMDCARGFLAGDVAWFELKSYISNGPGWEQNISQAVAPYRSINHFGQCGMLNVFRRNEDAGHILPLEVGVDPILVGAADIAWSNAGKDQTARRSTTPSAPSSGIPARGDPRRSPNA